MAIADRMGNWPVPRRRTYSLRLHMIVIAVSGILPMLVFSGVLTYQFLHQATLDEQDQLRRTALIISAGVDQRIERLISALAAVSTAPALAEHNLERFYHHSRAVAEMNGGWMLLLDVEGAPLFNTREPLGAPLQRLQNNTAAERALATGRPQVSNLFSTPDHANLIAILYPIAASEGPGRVLVMTIPAVEISNVFQEQEVSPTWSVAIIDRNGIILGRNQGLDRFMGKPMLPAHREKMLPLNEVTFSSSLPDGVEVYVASKRSQLTGWYTAVGVPRELLDGPPRQFLWTIIGGGAALLLLGLGVALWIGDRVRSSMRALADSALALGRGEPVPALSSSVREVVEMSEAEQTAFKLLTRRDVERQKAEATLRQREEHLAVAQGVAGTGSTEHDYHSGKTTWSREAYRILGLDPAVAEPSFDSFATLLDDQDKAEGALRHEMLTRGETPPPMEYRVHRPDGTIRIVSHDFRLISDAGDRPDRWIGILRDVTELRAAERERQELEQRFLHSQKLEALGTLAGGIAHDLNNTLLPIIGLSKLIRQRQEPGSRDYERLGVVLQAGERARELVRQILAFGRKDSTEKTQVDLQDLVIQSLTLLTASLPETIELERRIEKVPAVEADPGKLHQVLLNLVTNAAQAIGDKPGRIVVALDAQHASADGAEKGPSGDCVVRLTVSDTGCGMSESTLQRIFEPFFTTKPVGLGSGLGLAVAHGIVTSHGGTITVESLPGEGARFEVLLPCASEEAK